MTPKQKYIIYNFFQSKQQADQANFPVWFVDFLLKTKAQQKTEIIAWLDEQKTATQTAITNLDAQKTAQENNLNADIADMDVIENTL